MGDDLSLGTVKIESDYLPSESTSHRQPQTDRSHLSHLDINQVIETEPQEPAPAFTLSQLSFFEKTGLLKEFAVQ